MSLSDDLMSVRGRVQYALKKYNYSVYRLTDNESERSKLNKQINRGTTISAETIQVILTAFPDLSAEWLLRGEGDFSKSSSKATQLHQHIDTHGGDAAVSLNGNASHEKHSTNDTEVELLRDAIVQRDRQIELMQLLIDALRSGQKI